MARKDAVKGGSRWGRWKGRIRVALAAAAVVGACVAIRMVRGPAAADAKDQPRGSGIQQASATTPAQQQPQVVAVVNNEQIGRQELAQECLTHYGKDVLEAMVNKYLIVQYCQRQNVTVSKEEVNAEIDRMARKFNLAVDQWLKMLKDERGISPEQYANDIVWPTLALKKLAADRLKPTQQELQDAFETEFGEQVKARIILLNDPQTAAKVAALAKSDPESFGALAVKYSIDASASANGLIPPIRRHVGDPKLEQRVFAMRPGDITEPIQVGDQWALVKCEGHIPPDKRPFEQVRDKLADVIRERKLHTAAADVFQNLHKRAVIQNIYNDPVRSQQMPGVAAIVNDRKITVRELAEECIDKHGTEALEGTINRRLLEQAVRNKRLAVNDNDLNAEIARAAVAAGKVDKQKRPDMDGWIKTVCEEQGITAEIYYHDAVWPSVALRKLVGDVAVTKEDLDRGFIANYGPRVRCRVIMMTNQRRAQEVWEMARTELQKKNPDPEFFGRLAEQYSVDPSRAVQGRVPPIQRYGGMTQLETAAFALKPGELSGLIAVGDRFVILYCEGYTEPVKVEMADVKDVLYDDIHQKKLHMAMAEEFNRLKDSAQIDNYLTGTSHVPTRSGAAGHGDGERAAAINATSAGEHQK